MEKRVEYYAKQISLTKPETEVQNSLSAQEKSTLLSHLKRQ